VGKNIERTIKTYGVRSHEDFALARCINVNINESSKPEYQHQQDVFLYTKIILLRTR
jgi:hypothetical protein